MFGGLIDESCVGIPSSHGDFVGCIVSYAVYFMHEGLISPPQMASIITFAEELDQ